MRKATAGVGSTPTSQHVDAGAGQPGDDGGGEELARRAGVAADDREGPVPREGTRLAEDVRGRDRQVERQLGGEVAVGEAADAVGAEESSHEVCRSSAG